MLFFPNSLLFTKNNARNINYMSVLIFRKCLDLRKTPILGQPPRTGLVCFDSADFSTTRPHLLLKFCLL